MTNPKITATKYFAYIRGLAKGCTLCMKGVKLVVFITGMCGDRCFYCPVSRRKLYRDVVWADEEKVSRLKEIVLEAFRIGAEGAGITGGDPLYYSSRTIKLIKILKGILGESFHIHLYTSGRYATSSTLRSLEIAGLDEIRFHPTERWLIERIALAKRILKRTRIGVEVPVLPDKIDELKELIKLLDEMGIEFINLNELEASPANITALLSRGYKIDKDTSTVIGSEEAATNLIEWALRETSSISVHYCPARYKNSIQLRLRLVRKALRTKSPVEEVSPYGMIRVKVIKTKSKTQFADENKDIVDYETGNRLILAHPKLNVPGKLVEVQPFSKRFQRILKIISRSELQLNS